MSDFPRPSPKKPQERPSGPGIQAVHINLAREMVNMHLKDRNAPRPDSGPKRSNVPHNPLGSRREPVVSKPQFNAQVAVPAKSHQGPCSNPQCQHCGSVIIPLPKATYPLREEPSITVNDWSIFTKKGPILLSSELDHLNDTRFDFPLPEMIFGNNHVTLINEKTKATIDFNTLDALDSLAPKSDYKVAYHKEWLSTRPKASDMEQERETQQSLDLESTSGELESVKPYDWTYLTNYKGTVSDCTFSATEEKIPMEKLLRQDPILFYDESILFEDELGDNGISMLLTKIRVMHTCLLLLCRFSMRVDDVAFRIRDTRVYIDLETNVVMREYKCQEALYDELLRKISGRSSDPKKLLRDSNWVSQNIPVVSVEVEKMDTGN